MKKGILVVTVALLMGMQSIEGVDGESPVRWRDYLSGRSLYCYLSSSLAYAARSYQQAVLASLAMQGDSEAIKAWQELMATYSPSELMCMFGGEGIDALATGLSRIVPNIYGLSWAARQALETAIQRALEGVRFQG